MSPITWQNGLAGGTKLNATNLNGVQTDITSMGGRVTQLETLGGLAPGDVSDATVTNLVNNPASNLAQKLASTYAPRVTPSYAGARTKTWNPTLHLYNGESPALRKIRALVSRVRGGTSTYIAACGDSKTAGTGTGSGNAGKDSYPAQLLDLLGASEGMMYVERGSAGDSRWSGSTGFHTIDSAGRLYVTADDGTAGSITLTTARPHTGAEFYFYVGAATSVTIATDGGTANSYAVAAGSGFKKVTISGLSNATHTFAIAVPASPLVSFLGARPTYPVATLAISNTGRSGSTAANWFDTSWPLNGAAVFGKLNNAVPIPDAAFMDIGTNDATATLSNVDTVISTIVGYGTPLLLVVPGGLADASYYNSLRTRYYDLADTYDLPLIDFTDVVGSYTPAAAAGLMFDSLHENARGYALEAAAIARVISMY